MNRKKYSLRISFLMLVLFAGILPLSAQYNFEWAKKFSGPGHESGNSITLDADGNVYTTGFFEYTTDFDPGTSAYDLTAAAAEDIFITKLNASGDLVWAKSIGAAGKDIGYSITTDTAGYVYVAGLFTGTVDFNPGQGVNNLTSNGGTDIFVLKLDTSGNFIWARNMGGNGDDQALAVATDASGNVYTTGSFNDVADFNPGSGVSNLTSAGDQDIFVSKLNASGDFVWAKRMGSNSSGTETGRSLKTDASGNVYVTGEYIGSSDFDPGSGTVTLTSNGARDVFIMKLNTTGDLLWAKGVGSSSDFERGYSLALDKASNVYVSGEFGGTVDFDPGTGSTTLSTIATEVFILKLDASGNFAWVKRFAVDGFVALSTGANVLSLDDMGNIYTTGTFFGALDFDPGPDTYVLTDNTFTSTIFISKLNALGEFVWAVKLGGASMDMGMSLVADAIGNVYSTGRFSLSVDFDPSSALYFMDAVGSSSDAYIHKLSNCTVSSPLVQSVCDSFTFNGRIYTASGNYADTFFNATASGCDSIVLIDLTVNKSSHIRLTEQACDSFSLNGQTYNATGIYTQNYTTTHSCDSIITLDLTISATPDTTVIQVGSILIASAAGISYQWVDCNDGYAHIQGETSQSFTAGADGIYAVILTGDGGCSDTSHCFNTKGTGIADVIKTGNHLTLYPNPTTHMVVLNSDRPFNHADIRLLNLGGQVLRNETNVNGNRVQIDISTFAVGVYLLAITEHERTVMLRFEKI